MQQILRRRPDAARAFIEMRTRCVGCSMTRFCTPRDVAAYYAIDLEDLLSLLEKKRVTVGVVLL